MILTAKELEDRLWVKYGTDAWAFIPQVRNGTGFNHVTRYADGMAFGLWPSRGLEILGFEIKVSRNDWLQELKKPWKAEEISQFCDGWYLVCGDKDIVKPGELPKTWGLMVPYGQGLKIEVPSEGRNPSEINRSFMASIIRNFCENYVAKDSIKDRMKVEYDRGHKNGEDSRRYDYDRMKTEITDLRKKVEDFEKAAGFSLDQGWK